MDRERAPVYEHAVTASKSRRSPARFWIGVALLLLAAEAGARWLGFGHPLLYRGSASGYEPVPNQSVQRLRKRTTINNLGTRGPNTTPQPPSGTIRILSLGDSVANGGTQIDDEESYPLRLQAMLKGRFGARRVEVLNAAAGGWAVPNEARWLAAHGTLGAKFVILEVNEHDLDQAFVAADILDHNLSFPSHPPLTALGEIAARYIAPRLALAQPSADPGSLAGQFQAANVAPALGAVDAIRREAESRNARLIILYWDVRAPATGPAVAARARLFAWAKAARVPVVRPLLNARADANQLYRDGTHPNAAANLLIASQLATVLPALAQ